MYALNNNYFLIKQDCYKDPTKVTHYDYSRSFKKKEEGLTLRKLSESLTMYE